jgi:hypothetical protein
MRRGPQDSWQQVQLPDDLVHPVARADQGYRALPSTATRLQIVINYLRTQRAPVVCREAPDNVLLDLLDGTDVLPV